MSSSQLVSAREFKDRLFVRVVSARLLVVRDSSGTSDPYCSLIYGDVREKTKVQEKTLDPCWDETFTFLVDPRIESLKIEIWDSDFLKDDYMGEIVIDLRPIVRSHQFSTTWYHVVKGPNHKRPVTGDLQVGVGVLGITELLRKDPIKAAPNELAETLTTLERYCLGSDFDPHEFSAKYKLGKGFYTFPGRILVNESAFTIPPDYFPFGTDKDRKTVTLYAWVFALSLPVLPSPLFQSGSLSIATGQSGFTRPPLGPDTPHNLALMVGRWVQVAFVVTKASMALYLDTNKVFTWESGSIDPVVLLREPLQLGGKSANGAGMFAYVDHLSIVIGEMGSEDLKRAYDMTSPGDIVPKIWDTMEAPLEAAFLRAIPAVATKIVNFLTQIAQQGANAALKAQAKALLQKLATQVAVTLREAKDLASLSGVILPFVLAISREAGIEVLEAFNAASLEWDLNSDICRQSLSYIAPAFQAAVKGGSLYYPWAVCYVYLLSRIPANYTQSFYPSVLQDLCSLATKSDNPQLRKLATAALSTLAKNKGNRSQMQDLLMPRHGPGHLFEMMAQVPDPVTKKQLWDLCQDRLSAPAPTKTLLEDLTVLYPSGPAHLFDVTFQLPASHTSVRAHQGIVAARSKGLGDMILAERRNLGPGKEPDIRLEGVSERQMKAILSHIYFCQEKYLLSHLSITELLELFDSCGRFKLDDLGKLCLEQIKNGLRKPAEAVECLLTVRKMDNKALATELSDAATKSLMATKYDAIKNVDLRPLGPEYLEELFKRIRRKDVPAVTTTKVDMSVRFERDFSLLSRLGADFADFTIKVGDDSVPAWRCMLYARSKYFRDLLGQREVPSSVPLNASLEVVETILAFIYSDNPSLGRCEHSDALLYELLAVLEVLQLTNQSLFGAALKKLRAGMVASPGSERRL